MKMTGIASPTATTLPKAAVKAPAPVQTFSDMLGKSIAAVSADANEAEALSEGLAAGEHANIHETMIALEKANVSFRLMTRVQNKVINAYNEIMRMQI